MRTPTMLIATALSLRSQAQITITQADMPSLGDTVRRATAAFPSFDESETGPGYFWDFSSLTATGQVADTCVGVSATPLLYQLFFNNNILYPDHAASFGIKGSDISISTYSLTDVYNYYKKTSSAYSAVGFGANVLGVPTSIRRVPTDIIHEFPLVYGNTDDSFSAWEVDVPSIAYIRQEQSRYNEVDGWGTLLLPNGGTYQVLRVKSTLERTDSIYISTLGFGFNIPEPETVEYKWIAQGLDAPVLEITTTSGIATEARFAESELSTDLNEHHDPERVIAYPNPADDQLNLVVSGVKADGVNVTDATGRAVSVPIILDGDHIGIDVRHLENGHYQVRSHRVDGRTAIARIIVQHR